MGASVIAGWPQPAQKHNPPWSSRTIDKTHKHRHRAHQHKAQQPSSPTAASTQKLLCAVLSRSHPQSMVEKIAKMYYYKTRATRTPNKAKKGITRRDCTYIYTSGNANHWLVEPHEQRLISDWIFTKCTRVITCSSRDEGAVRLA